MSSLPFDQVEMKPETRQLLREAIFFEPLPFVTQVVFIATPHRGSEEVEKMKRSCCGKCAEYADCHGAAKAAGRRSDDDEEDLEEETDFEDEGLDEEDEEDDMDEDLDEEDLDDEDEDLDDEDYEEEETSSRRRS